MTPRDFHRPAATRGLTVAGLLAGLAAGPNTWAEERALEFRGGWFFPQFDTDLRVDSRLDTGTRVNLEDDLGLEHSTHTWFAGAKWRFFKRHRLTVEYWKTERSASRGLSRAITVEDEVYQLGARMDTHFNLEMVPVSYSFSFLKSERHELAASLGVHWSRLEFGLLGSASVPVNGAMEDGNTSVDIRPDLPLPLLGLDYEFKVTDNWKLSTRAGYFSMDIKDVDGSLIAAGIETEYWLGKHVAAGFGVDYFKLGVRADLDSFRGDTEYSYVGPKAFFKLGF